MAKYELRSNLTERQIESDVAQYLAWCFKPGAARLLDVNEQLTGADRLFDTTIPIYLQFKVSHGLKPIWQVTPSGRSNASALEAVRTFRAHFDLSDNPTLYFQLRWKAEHATDLQHNILLANNKPGVSYAVYVAPLYLDKDIYYNALIKGPYDDPWYYEYPRITDEEHAYSLVNMFPRQPFLLNHACIAPHARVTTHKHYYSYSSTGDEVSWHSEPEIIEGGPFRLSDFMNRRVRDIFLGEGDLVTPDQALGVALEAMNVLDVRMGELELDGSAFDRLRQYGRWLWKTHGIRQMLICGHRDKILKIRSELMRGL